METQNSLLPKIKWKNIRREINSLLIGTLFQPWIWAFGFEILLGFSGILVFYGFGDSTALSTIESSNEGFNVLQIWLISLIFVCFNYYIYYKYRYIYPKLTPILFLMSLFCIMITAFIFRSVIISLI
jgi:hypothetical protein